MDHHHRRADQRRDRVSGNAVRQHHGLRAGLVQLLHRSPIRYGRTRNALETGDRPWRILGTTVRDSFVDRYVDLGKTRSFGAALCGTLSPRQRPCPGYVSGALVLCSLRDSDGGGESSDETHARRPVDWTGIRVDESSLRRGRPSVSEASFLGGGGDGQFLHTEHYFLVNVILRKWRPAASLASGYLSAFHWASMSR